MIDLHALIERLDGELYALSQAGRLEIVEEDLANRATEPLIAAIEAAHGPLPPPLGQLYRAAGSVRVTWQTPDTELRGCLAIPSLDAMFGDVPWQELIAAGAMDHGRLYALDTFSAEWWAVLRPASDRVWLHEVGMPTLHDTGLSISQWLELGAEARFLEGWLFTRGPSEAARVEAFSQLARAQALFPSLELARFR